MHDYLALPEVTADHYPSTKDVLRYINNQLDSWWYGRLEHRLTDSLSIEEKFEKIKSKVSALDPLINRRDRLLATCQEKGVELASSFVEQLERLGEQADLTTFNGEALLCQLIASGVRELELKKKILELGVEKLTLANVKTTIRTLRRYIL